MTDAFARAAADIHADLNVSLAADYTPAPTRALAATPVRVILSRPVDPIQGYGRGVGVTSTATLASLPVAALPYEPLRGDSLTIGADTFTVETPDLDPERTTWSLPLSAT